MFPAFAAKYHSYTLVIVDGNLRTDDYLIRVPSNDVDVISTNLIKCTAFYDLGERILCEVSRFTTQLSHHQSVTDTVNLFSSYIMLTGTSSCIKTLIVIAQPSDYFLNKRE